MPLKMYEEAKSKPPSRTQRTIAIAAGKGGVGKSSVTINLALALQQQGFRVGVMDADIYGPSARKMLPEDRLPSQKGQTIFPALCRGIQMISMAYFRKDNEATAVRAPIANGIVSQFVHNVSWEDLDFLLIDFPPGTGDIQITLSQQLQLTGAVMVTTPQDVAVLDVRKAMHLFDQVHVPIIGVIENMSYFFHQKCQEMLYLFGKGGGERLARETGVPFLGEIPIDPMMSWCGDHGTSIFDKKNGDSQAVIDAFTFLAKQVNDHTEILQLQSTQGLQHVDLQWKDM